MTHYRPPGSLEDTLRDAVSELSATEIKAATGKSQSRFYQISMPGCGSELDFEDAAAIDAALVAKGQHPRFQPLLRDLTAAVLARLRGVEPEGLDLLSGMCRLSKEVLDLHLAADLAMQNGLDRETRRRLAREAQDVIDHAKAIRNAVEPPFEGSTASVTPLRPDGPSAA